MDAARRFDAFVREHGAEIAEGMARRDQCDFWSEFGLEGKPCRSCQTCVESKDWLDGLEALES